MRINWKNPLTRGLVALIAGDSPQNLVRNNAQVFTGFTTQGGDPHHFSQRKRELLINADSTYYPTRLEYGALGARVEPRNTVLCFFNPYDASTGRSVNSTLYSLGDGADNGVLFHQNGGAGLTATINTLTTWYYVAATKVIPANKWIAISTRYDNEVFSLWFDGVKDNENATPSGDTTLGDGSLYIGGDNYAEGYVRGRYALVAVWDRDLSDEEMAAVGQRPLQLLERPPFYLFTEKYNSSMYYDGTFGPIGNILTITLVNASGTILPNLTGLSWAWFDQSTPDSASTPTAQGNSETTDASGILELDLTGTTLTTGQTGMLALKDSTGMIYAWYRITL